MCTLDLDPEPSPLTLLKTSTSLKSSGKEILSNGWLMDKSITLKISSETSMEEEEPILTQLTDNHSTRDSSLFSILQLEEDSLEPTQTL